MTTGMLVVAAVIGFAQSNGTLNVKLPPTDPTVQPLHRPAAKHPRSFAHKHIGIAGQLGMVLVDADIHSGRGIGTVVVARVSSGTYLALTAEEDNWYGVLMSDNSVGWVQRSHVKVMNYEVIHSPQPTHQLSPVELAIRRHKLLIGMAKDEVRRSWGAPRSKHHVESRFGTYESWTYSRGRRLEFANGILELIAD